MYESDILVIIQLLFSQIVLTQSTNIYRELANNLSNSYIFEKLDSGIQKITREVLLHKTL